MVQINKELRSLKSENISGCCTACMRYASGMKDQLKSETAIDREFCSNFKKSSMSIDNIIEELKKLGEYYTNNITFKPWMNVLSAVNYFYNILLCIQDSILFNNNFNPVII
jgi:hypothetical protein